MGHVEEVGALASSLVHLVLWVASVVVFHPVLLDLLVASAVVGAVYRRVHLEALVAMMVALRLVHQVVLAAMVVFHLAVLEASILRHLDVYADLHVDLHVVGVGFCVGL